LIDPLINVWNSLKLGSLLFVIIALSFLIFKVSSKYEKKMKIRGKITKRK